MRFLGVLVISYLIVLRKSECGSFTTNEIFDKDEKGKILETTKIISKNLNASESNDVGTSETITDSTLSREITNTMFEFTQNHTTVEKTSLTPKNLATTTLIETTTNNESITTITSIENPTSTLNASPTESSTSQPITLQPNTTETPATSTTEYPGEGCSINNSSYNLSDINILTIQWTLNTTSCILNRTQIWLKNLTCEAKCPPANFTCVPNCNNCITNCATIAREIPVLNYNYQFRIPLEPCAEYQYVFYFRGESIYSTNFTANQNEAIARPKNLTVFDQVQPGATNILNMTINWDYDYACKQDFRVILQSTENNKNEVVNGLTKTFQDIAACTNYTIKVSSKTEDDHDFTASTQFISRRVDPSTIRDLNVTSKVESNIVVIDVRWDKPTYGAQCVNSYEIMSVSSYESRRENVECCSYSILNVYPCVHYNVTIRTSSNESQMITTTQMTSTTIATSIFTGFPFSDGKSEQSETRDVRSGSIVFSEIPPPIVFDLTDTSFDLSISLNTTRNKCEISEYEFTCTNSANYPNATKKSNTSSVTLTKLEPFTDYSCSVKVLNEAGWSESGYTISLKTLEGSPNAPSVFVNHDTVKSTEFTFFWHEPTKPKGEIKNYKIYIKFIKYLYENPGYCSSSPVQSEFNHTIYVENMKNRSYTFTNASPYSRYLISIQANNINKEGDYSNSSSVDTLSDKSESINFTISQIEIRPEIVYNNEALIQWQYPCNANGNLLKFEIRYGPSGNKEKFVPVEVVKLQYNYQHSIVVTPSLWYVVTIVPYSIDNIGNVSVKNFTLKAGIPEPSHINEIAKNVKVKAQAKQTVTLSQLNYLFNSTVGTVNQIIVLVHQRDCGAPVLLKRNLKDFDDIDRMPFWLNISQEKCVPQYQSLKILDPIKVAEDTIIIGSETCNGQFEICNGPLKSGTKYSLTMRFYTETGFADSKFIDFDTDNQTPIVTIIISFFVIMCIVFVIGFYITYKKPRNQMDNQFDRKDVPIQYFQEFHAEMIKNENEKAKEEYKAINIFSDGLDKTTLASKVNEKYNRYTNISPFDENRVTLGDDEFENDYINASFINGYHYAKEYIAAQGPKINTSHDFWRMVLLYKTESIVMLTSLVENNKIKCHEYFPKLNGHVTFDNIKIVCTNEQNFPNYVKRILQVEKDDVKHTVKHYYFLKWMDHSACNVNDLIDFVKIVRNERQHSTGTFIVHCSAGVGRTGTFIALDILMQRLKQEKKVNIFDLVKQLRKQRMKMVQSFDQYTLIYNAALELTSVRTKGPRVLQNISMYIENIELFKKWTRRGGNLRDRNENRAKVDDKESVL